MQYGDDKRLGFHKVMDIHGDWNALQEQINIHVLSGYWKLCGWQSVANDEWRFIVVFERIKGK